MLSIYTRLLNLRRPTRKNVIIVNLSNILVYPINRGGGIQRRVLILLYRSDYDIKIVTQIGSSFIVTEQYKDRKAFPICHLAHTEGSLLLER